MEIIDFHTHPYLSFEENWCFYKDVVNLSPEEAKDDLISSGISAICGSVLSRIKYTAAEGFDRIRELNDEALRIRELYGSDFYTPGFHVHPAFFEESVKEIERMKKEGVVLVGELVPYAQDWKSGSYNYGSKEFSYILDAVANNKMIVSYHTMTEFNDETDRMLESHPDITFVAAHPGDRDDFFRQLERLKVYPNVLLDLSGTGLFRYGLVRKAVKDVGADRIVFGTDYPICNPRMYVEAVKGEKLAVEDERRIFSGNAKRIFGKK